MLLVAHPSQVHQKVPASLSVCLFSRTEHWSAQPSSGTRRPCTMSARWSAKLSAKNPRSPRAPGAQRSRHSSAWTSASMIHHCSNHCPKHCESGWTRASSGAKSWKLWELRAQHAQRLSWRSRRHKDLSGVRDSNCNSGGHDPGRSLMQFRALREAPTKVPKGGVRPAKKNICFCCSFLKGRNITDN